MRKTFAHVSPHRCIPFFISTFVLFPYFSPEWRVPDVSLPLSRPHARPPASQSEATRTHSRAIVHVSDACVDEISASFPLLLRSCHSPSPNQYLLSPHLRIQSPFPLLSRVVLASLILPSSPTPSLSPAAMWAQIIPAPSMR